MQYVARVHLSTKSFITAQTFTIYRSAFSCVILPARRLSSMCDHISQRKYFKKRGWSETLQLLLWVELLNRLHTAVFSFSLLPSKTNRIQACSYVTVVDILNFE